MKPEVSYTWDDKGMGELFADVFWNYARFNVTAKEWYIYDGIVWKADPGAMIVSQYAKELANALLVYCSTIEDERQKSEYLKMILRYGQLRYRETMVKDARDKFFISQTDLDKNLDLFNCQNGTYNLRTGEFRHHNPVDLLSKVSSVIYIPGARSEEWERFISEIMLHDAAKISYLQTISGYALTAETSLECCWILYGGTTRNGKSTFVETLSYLMGNGAGYALAMQPQTLAQKQNKDTRQASGDIARLDGCRFLNASEPPKRMLFDVALLKTLLGRDSITARHLFEREFEFIPRFKLFINTNFLPVIQDDSLFSSGRINVITFDRHFSPQEQDRNLKDKLKTPENISGIFNWCLDGLKRFRKSGAIPPKAVQEATAEYRQSSDKIGNFIQDCLIRAEGKNCAAGSVYQRYSEWCDNNGFGTENKGNFYDELRSKGIFAASGTVNGITVRNVVKGYIL
jgi:putative DNA primase/helicase